MSVPNPSRELFPPALLAEVEAVAAEEQRHPRDLLREAVELYLNDRRARVDAAQTAGQSARVAAARILERRKLHRLPAGTSIDDLIGFGRA